MRGFSDLFAYRLHAYVYYESFGRNGNGGIEMENRYRARESSSYVCICIDIYIGERVCDFLQVQGSTLSWHKNGTQPQQSDAANN